MFERMQARFILTGAGALLLAAFAHTAQDPGVQYTTVNRIEFEGALGTAMRVAARFGGGVPETKETVSIQGSMMRTDEEGTSTIIDLEGQRVVMLYHESRSFTELTFEEMRRLAEDMAARFTEEMGAAREAEREAGEEREAMREDIEWTFDVRVEPTSERQRINGIDTEQVFLTVKVEGRGVGEEHEGMESFGFVLLSEMWMSDGLPEYEQIRKFEEEWVQVVGEVHRDEEMAEALAQAFATDPRMKEALERAQVESGNLDGHPVRTTTYFVTVPDGVDFDRQLALGVGQGQPEETGRLGRFARAAAQRAAEQRVGVQRDRGQADPAEPRQVTIMKMIQEIQEIGSKVLPTSLFEVPEGYRPVALGGG